MVKNWFKDNAATFYAIFRILIGLLFLQHGAQKLFGAFGATAQAAFGLMWFVGLAEFLGGLFIVIGLLTRPSAIVSAIVMLVAYIWKHAPGGPIPVMNRGELALVYLAAFLVIIAYGARKWSLEKSMLGRELV